MSNTGDQPRVEGVEERDESDDEIRDPESQDNPDEGPTMTGAGAEPGGNAMDHWATAMPNTDATKPETMPEALGGEGKTPNVDEQSNPA
ncbi:MAG TPA: hypothetical protein VHF91_01655 [Acidimicrobiales bacterium]|nr:hypothetical protein [Acidimicrobiales bacterium]